MKKILIMDDEPAFIKSVMYRLDQQGISRDQIIYCQQIDECFSALSNMHRDIACVSMDLLIGDNMNMLEGDSVIMGINALSQISSQYPNMPIVCFSILSLDDGEISSTIEKNKAEFISKTDKDALVRLTEFFKRHLNA